MSEKSLLRSYRLGVRDTWEILLRRLEEARSQGLSLAEFEAVAKAAHAELSKTLPSGDATET